MHVSGPQAVNPYKIVFSYNDQAHMLGDMPLTKNATLYFSEEAGKLACEVMYNTYKMFVSNSESMLTK